MRLEDMTPEMIEKAKGCETAEERKAFLEENGIELDEEQLEGIAGGNRPNEQVGIPTYCPRHSSHEHWWSNSGITKRNDSSIECMSA